MAKLVAELVSELTPPSICCREVHLVCSGAWIPEESPRGYPRQVHYVHGLIERIAQLAYDMRGDVFQQLLDVVTTRHTPFAFQYCDLHDPFNEPSGAS